MLAPTEEGATPPSGDQFVQSLARGLAIITAFDDDHAAMTLTEVAGRTQLTRATARRFLLTLTSLGYVRNDGSRFALTPKILSLGTAYLSSFGLPQIAQPHLEELSAELGESVSASVLDGNDIVYIARVSTRRIMTVGISVGTRFPAYATSMGRVLLAGLDEDVLEASMPDLDMQELTPRTIHTPDALRAELARVRSQGWAIVDQELEIGLRSIAAPIRNRAGQVAAAINVSTPAGTDLSKKAIQSYVTALLATAKSISTDVQTFPSTA